MVTWPPSSAEGEGAGVADAGSSRYCHILFVAVLSIGGGGCGEPDLSDPRKSDIISLRK
jgi:hypothetical protein